MILLSFDIEAFDMPLEYGKEISFQDQIDISIAGTRHILDILDKHGVKATFFSTVIFAQNAADVIKRIINSGHELASHGYFHSAFEPAHLASSRKALQEISSQEIIGFRMPRMRPVDENEVRKAGYLYNSSINPTWLPGRYNNLARPRTRFKEAGIWQIPASVSPVLRFPLFWLSFHNLPLGIYKWLAQKTHKADGYLNIYFHPWEFADLSKYPLPAHVKKGHNGPLRDKLRTFLKQMKGEGEFTTMAKMLKAYE